MSARHTLAEEMVELGRKLWGEPNRERSTSTDIRFGAHGSKSIRVDKGEWYDHETGEGGGYATLYCKSHGHYPDHNGHASDIAAAYDYHDASGRLVYQVVRKIPKDFRQRRPNGKGGWIWNLKGVERVPYHLPELLASAPDTAVYIVEGEKDADSLRKYGLVATCNPGGASKPVPGKPYTGKWLGSYSEHLRGRHVVVLADNDEPGEAHAQDVARKLTGIASSVCILHLPNLPPKGDVSDWLAAGGTVEELERLATETPKAEPQTDAKNGTADIWLASAQCDANWEPRPNLFNVMLGLRQDPQLAELLGYDGMLRATVLLRPIPRSHGQAFSPHLITDADVSALQEFLQASGLPKIGRELVHQAVDLRATERTFQPLRDYLDHLEWDGNPRLAIWTTTYLGAEDTEYHRLIGCMFIVSMVARIYEPGCQVDYMAVLEGEQGEQKSSACRTLAGDEYFSDALPTVGTDPVRISQHLRGKWLIEIAEMSAMTKAESEDLKAFITRRQEQYTPKYARKEVMEPRQCVFIGTTNKNSYLRDETGGRRYWPIKTGQIDLPALKRDRDQLFAEAVYHYRQGFHWWPDRDFERQHIAPMQDARFEADAWEQPIAEWLNDAPSPRQRTTVMEVARDALNIETARLNMADQRRIKAALTRLGWKEGNRTAGGRWWVPVKAAGRAF